MRKPTTGRFETREELEDFIWDQWQNTPRKIIEIARAAKVSASTAGKILDKPSASRSSSNTRQV